MSYQCINCNTNQPSFKALISLRVIQSTWGAKIVSISQMHGRSTLYHVLFQNLCVFVYVFVCSLFFFSICLTASTWSASLGFAQYIFINMATFLILMSDLRIISFNTQGMQGMVYLKNSKWVWSGNTTITNCRQPRGTVRKSRSTITRHQEDKLSKAISSLFPIKMIAILKWTKSNVQQNIEQLQTPTMGVTINRKSTTTEPPP